MTEWLAGEAVRRPGIRGVFAWSFYENRSADEWADELLRWFRRSFDVHVGGVRPALQILAATRKVPVALLLDGLEVIQEGPGGSDVGRFLEPIVRDTLTGLCQIKHSGLVLLTSRFPFADLERFDGGTARMLDVLPFTPEEGADLLASEGAEWLPAEERLNLVREIDGHALAVGVLARALSGQPPTSELAALRRDLIRSAHTDERVGKVLAFYAAQLSESDRMLVAIVSLFQRPIAAVTVLALGQHDMLGAPLCGWSTARLEVAVRSRLGGLLVWHADASISAHPLVRDAFRPLALSQDAASLASDLGLGDLPAGIVTTPSEALRITEMVELLIEAGQWAAADQLHRTRVGVSPSGFITLPAPRLGLRCALAFVSHPARMDACRRELSDAKLTFYLNQAGLFAMNSGDLDSAQRLLIDKIDVAHSIHDVPRAIRGLLNLAECFAWLGHGDKAREVAIEALRLAMDIGKQSAIDESLTFLGVALDLQGESVEADALFVASDESWLRNNHRHASSLAGTLWGDFLLRTGRHRVSRHLTERNQDSSGRWKSDLGRCRRLLARCDLAEGHIASTDGLLNFAVDTFRDGEMLLEFSACLPDLAEQERRAGNLDAADDASVQAITLASPRGLVPVGARALAVRAKVFGDTFARTLDRNDLERARDMADAALRLATRVRQIPWEELAAYDAHAHLDELEDLDRNWRSRADQLAHRLMPTALDSNPLRTASANSSSPAQSAFAKAVQRKWSQLATGFRPTGSAETRRSMR
ncbi:MAG: hypothetical protein M3256_10990 [Actinomycetota bacterium]|nr:hypothetical protein [Actinomycetota bacterium]